MLGKKGVGPKLKPMMGDTLSHIIERFYPVTFQRQEVSRQYLSTKKNSISKVVVRSTRYFQTQFSDSEQDPGPIQGYCEHGDESSIKEGMYSSVECQLSYNRGFS